jgi:DNA polymerase III subunit delta
MAQAPEIVLKDLKEGKFAPVYFLQGEETFYIDQIADYIEKHALNETEKGFNQVVMYGKDAEMSAVITNARRFPMMSERQVVIVKEAQDIPDLSKETGQKLLESYVKNPLPSTILVLCHKYKTLDGRKGLAQVMDKFAVLVTTKKMYDNQVPDWISKHIREKGFKADEKAVKILADNIGNNLERLANEINKITINIKEQDLITADLVQKYVGISKDYNVFELQKAIAVRDIIKVNQIINYFDANPKDNPIIPVITVIFNFFNKLLLVHQSKDKSERTLASLLQLNPYFVKEFLIAAGKYPLPKVVANIHHLRIADLQSKGVDSANLSEGQILKELMFKLMH